MKVPTIQLYQEPYKSFIVHHEKDPFTPWHHHPEYELVLIVNGKGRRIVGDNVSRFEENDLIFVGPHLPHQWICDAENSENPIGIQNEAFVIQFSNQFMDGTFFEAPENAGLKNFLNASGRGIEFFGTAKKHIILILYKMFEMNDTKRLYSLLQIFEVMSSAKEYKNLASPNTLNNFSSKSNEPMQKAMQYILQNFKKKIQMQDLLDITHKSYASFYSTFKKAFMMSFQDYLINVRIGYACQLLAEGSMTIIEIAYDSGFENISNFNRQFKKNKKTTPTQFQKQYKV